MVKVTQLAGKGVAGLESDPPLYHFDATPEELGQLIADPQRFLEEAGLPGTAANNIALSKWTEAYSPERGWGPRKDGGAASSCCYVSDNSMTCHVHAQ
ncbi:hypothetical protein ACSNOH_04295 [Streptomyces sp. URMC 127]|uniref:hypothetical protein n=1 Tax=Streptomyces sp. URMC 127 TaxID=3423402 RepID=UPI003F1A9A9A